MSRGRKPLFEQPMTSAERKARQRAAQRAVPPAPKQPPAPARPPRPYDRRQGGATWLLPSKDRDHQVQAADAVPDAEAFNRELCQRTQRLRKSAGLSQGDVAKILGPTRKTYATWEQRLPMPAYLMPAFARLVGTDCNFLLTGRALKETR
jgi:hypothetical protein